MWRVREVLHVLHASFGQLIEAELVVDGARRVEQEDRVRQVSVEERTPRTLHARVERSRRERPRLLLRLLLQLLLLLLLLLLLRRVNVRRSG